MRTNLSWVAIALCFGISFLFGLGILVDWKTASEFRYWPFGVDVYPHWVATRAIWRGDSPYSLQVLRETQQLIYARPLEPGDDPFGFYYPAYVSFIILPLTWLPVEWAGLVWSAVNWAGLVTLAIVWSWRIKPRLPPIPWGLVLLSVIFYRPAFLAVINGQYGLFVVACTLGVWWLIRARHDGWAGGLLAFATIKPSISLLAPLVILLWAARERRWNGVSGFLIALGLLVGAMTLRIGWWVPDFLRASQSFASKPGSWMTQDIFSLAGFVWLAGALALLGIGLVHLWSRRDFPWLAIIGALCLNLLIIPHLLEYDLTVLLLALFWLGAQWRTVRWGLAGWLVLIWMPWLSWLFLLAIGGTTEQWWKLIWQFYPSLLIYAMLVWVWRTWRDNPNAGAK
ncbi:MAG: DUF2029 domain-containing protein [Chloroflexi bacterium]|nr:DUF2029 domain-containing protein [Chloroflexota bacterium]